MATSLPPAEGAASYPEFDVDALRRTSETPLTRFETFYRFFSKLSDSMRSHKRLGDDDVDDESDDDDVSEEEEEGEGAGKEKGTPRNSDAEDAGVDDAVKTSRLNGLVLRNLQRRFLIVRVVRRLTTALPKTKDLPPEFSDDNVIHVVLPCSSLVLSDTKRLGIAATSALLALRKERDGEAHVYSTPPTIAVKGEEAAEEEEGEVSSSLSKKLAMGKKDDVGDDEPGTTPKVVEYVPLWSDVASFQPKEEELLKLLLLDPAALREFRKVSILNRLLSVIDGEEDDGDGIVAKRHTEPYWPTYEQVLNLVNLARLFLQLGFVRWAYLVCRCLQNPTFSGSPVSPLISERMRIFQSVNNKEHTMYLANLMKCYGHLQTSPVDEGEEEGDPAASVSVISVALLNRLKVFESVVTGGGSPVFWPGQHELLVLCGQSRLFDNLRVHVPTHLISHEDFKDLRSEDGRPVSFADESRAWRKILWEDRASLARAGGATLVLVSGEEGSEEGGESPPSADASADASPATNIGEELILQTHVLQKIPAHLEVVIVQSNLFSRLLKFGGLETASIEKFGEVRVEESLPEQVLVLMKFFYQGWVVTRRFPLVYFLKTHANMYHCKDLGLSADIAYFQSVRILFDKRTIEDSLLSCLPYLHQDDFRATFVEAFVRRAHQQVAEAKRVLARVIAAKRSPRPRARQTKPVPPLPDWYQSWKDAGSPSYDASVLESWILHALPKLPDDAFRKSFVEEFLEKDHRIRNRIFRLKEYLHHHAPARPRRRYGQAEKSRKVERAPTPPPSGRRRRPIFRERRKRREEKRSVTPTGRLHGERFEKVKVVPRGPGGKRRTKAQAPPARTRHGYGHYTPPPVDPVPILSGELLDEILPVMKKTSLKERVVVLSRKKKQKKKKRKKKPKQAKEKQKKKKKKGGIVGFFSRLFSRKNKKKKADPVFVRARRNHDGPRRRIIGDGPPAAVVEARMRGQDGPIIPHPRTRIRGVVRRVRSVGYAPSSAAIRQAAVPIPPAPAAAAARRRRRARSRSPPRPPLSVRERMGRMRGQPKKKSEKRKSF